jgi:LPXTG-site transpeptidase (sortase) family protein
MALTGTGVVLIWGALALGGYAFGWQSHKSSAQAALLAGEHRAVEHVRHTDPNRPCVVDAPGAGQLAGELSIPALHLEAPVEEGTGDAVLSVAVGHDPSSVWPGQTGTAVLLAHDVSYFVHLNELKPGDLVVYQNACETLHFTVSGHQVVAQGTPVPNSTSPSLVLDTCYPPDALFFTTQRYLVQATETVRAAPGRTPGSKGLPATLPTAPSSRAYRVPAPAALVVKGLTLQQNETPMGTMTLAGTPTPSWEQSPGPLNLEAAALEAYFGGLDAAGASQLPWWDAIAVPGLAPPAQLLGARISESDAPLDVTIDSSHRVATRVVLTTVVTLTGGTAPGTYQEAVTMQITGSTVLLEGWNLTPT